MRAHMLFNIQIVLALCVRVTYSAGSGLYSGGIVLWVGELALYKGLKLWLVHNMRCEKECWLVPFAELGLSYHEVGGSSSLTESQVVNFITSDRTCALKYWDRGFKSGHGLWLVHKMRRGKNVDWFSRQSSGFHLVRLGIEARSRTHSWYTLSHFTKRTLSNLGIEGSNLLMDSLVVSLVTIFGHH